MTREQAMNYLTDVEVMSGKATGLQRDVAIVRFAEDRGFYVGFDNIYKVEYAGAVVDGNSDDEYFDNYDGNATDEIRYCAREALAYLNDHDLLPQGYGYDDERPEDGYGDGVEG